MPQNSKGDKTKESVTTGSTIWWDLCSISRKVPVLYLPSRKLLYPCILNTEGRPNRPNVMGTLLCLCWNIIHDEYHSQSSYHFQWDHWILISNSWIWEEYKFIIAYSFLHMLLHSHLNTHISSYNLLHYLWKNFFYVDIKCTT